MPWVAAPRAYTVPDYVFKKQTTRNLLQVPFGSVTRHNLISRHGLALLCLARNPDSRLREIGDFVGVTERAAHGLVGDLVESGYVVRERVGNRNHYELRADTPLSQPGLDGLRLGDLIVALNPDSAGTSA